MKFIIFLVFLGLALFGLFWKLRQSQAEADRARREALERRRVKEREALKPTADVKWPVIIRPVGGKHPPGDEPEVDQPTMASIEFEPSEPVEAPPSKSAEAKN